MERVVCALKDRKLIFSVGFTFLWGMVAHAYGLLNSIFSHDSLNALVAGMPEHKMKIALGRFMATVYRLCFRKGIAMPWLIGIVALLLIGISVYLTCRMLDLESIWEIALVSGFYAANLTVTALIGTYVHDLDIDMFALLFAVLSVWCWDRYRYGFLSGIVLLAGSLGFYQAYVSVALVLMILLSIRSCIRKEKTILILRKGLLGILMTVLAGLMYSALVSVSCRLTHVSLSSRDGIDLQTVAGRFGASVLKNVAGAYGEWFRKAFSSVPVYPDWLQAVLISVLMGIMLASLAVVAVREKQDWKTILLEMVLVLLIPLASNALSVLGKEGMPDLLMFSAYCFFVLVVFLVSCAYRTLPGKGCFGMRVAAVVCMLTLLWGNVQTSNILYLKKDLERQSALSTMTRVVDKIETFPEYIMNETPVAFFGKYPQRTVRGFEDMIQIEGAGFSGTITSSHPLSYFNIYQAYCNYILNCNIRICEDEVWYHLLETPELEQMPCYPEEGCMQIIEETLVVKMNNSY